MYKVTKGDRWVAWAAAGFVGTLLAIILILMDAPTWGWFGIAYSYYSIQANIMSIHMRLGLAKTSKPEKDPRY